MLLEGRVVAGRNPGDGGIVLSPEDGSVSSRAVEIFPTSEGVGIKNLSTYAQIDVYHDSGTRFLFPGETLETTSDVRVLIPGNVYSHQIDVKVESKKNKAKPTSKSTSRLVPADLTIPQERFPALVCLCLARFFPDRFGISLLSAAKIAELLSSPTELMTAKAVNHKLQRIREDIADRAEVYLDSREDLADWVIRNGYVSRSDAEGFLGNQGTP